MTTTMARDMLRERPFRPFRVVMSSGEAYDIRHPEMAWVTKNDLFVGIDVADDGLPADARICPLFHVAVSAHQNHAFYEAVSATSRRSTLLREPSSSSFEGLGVGP
jgi:hypothetical protein